MSDNFGIGNKFDVAWKQAQQQLIANGNEKPTTQDILHYLVDKWKPNKQQGEQMIVQGFHMEHAPADMTPKYGVNIGCSRIDTAPVMKYGANIGCNQDTTPVMKYGANIGGALDTTPVMKYGANIGGAQDLTPVMKYGANIGGAQDLTPVMKYGANVGCSNLKVNLKSRKFINTIRANMNRVHPHYQFDINNRTVKVIKKEN